MAAGIQLTQSFNRQQQDAPRAILENYCRQRLQKSLVDQIYSITQIANTATCENCRHQSLSKYNIERDAGAKTHRENFSTSYMC